MLPTVLITELAISPPVAPFEAFPFEDFPFEDFPFEPFQKKKKKISKRFTLPIARILCVKNARAWLLMFSNSKKL